MLIRQRNFLDRSPNADRNFKMDYNVAGGSYTDLNYNTVNTNGNNGNNMFGNVRGDSCQNGGINIFTSFLIVGNGIDPYHTDC